MARQLCRADYALIFRFSGGAYRLAAASQAQTAHVTHASDHPIAPGRGVCIARTWFEKRTIHIHDVLSDPEYEIFEYQESGKFRTVIAQLESARLWAVIEDRASVGAGQRDRAFDSETVGLDEETVARYRKLDISAGQTGLGEAIASREPLSTPDVAKWSSNALRDAALEAGMHKVLSPAVVRRPTMGRAVMARIVGRGQRAMRRTWRAWPWRKQPGREETTMRTRIRLATIISLVAWGDLVAAQQVTVRMWMHEHPPRIAIDKGVIADFEKANPDIKVQYDVISGPEYSTKLLTAFAAGSGPDLFNNTSTLVTQYFAARILAPIDYDAFGYANEAALLAKFQGGFDGIRFQGKLYGVPTEVSNWACFANNAIWREAGLDPKTDWPKTWEALPAAAEKLTKRDRNGVPIRRGFDFAWTIPGTFWFTPNTMIHQLGASMIDEGNYQAALNTAPSRRAFQYLQDWAVKYRLGGPQYTASRTDFLAGKLATECSFGIWGIPQMRAAGIDWTVMPAPRWADAVSDNGLDIYAYYMMVNARSAPAAQKAAWKLARFYTDHAAALFSGAGLFVPRTEVTESAAYKENSAAPFFLAELKKAKFSPRVVGYTQVLDTILRGKDKLVQGEKIDDVLLIMNEEVNAVMNRERARASTLVK